MASPPPIFFPQVAAASTMTLHLAQQLDEDAKKKEKKRKEQEKEQETKVRRKRVFRSANPEGLTIPGVIPKIPSGKKSSEEPAMVTAPEGWDVE